MKKCTSCGGNKELDEFYKYAKAKDGLTASCKECIKLRDKRRYRTPKRQRWIKEKYTLYVQHNLARITKRKSEWLKRNPDKRRRITQKYYKKVMGNSVKHNKLLARRKLRYHVKMGNIQKLPCEVCGNLIVHGHHDDYTQPLKVRWLCHQHHIEFHKNKLALK